ncbi:DUF7210 family protein [Pseudomonas aeruginosa]|uniref:DUF7210 family protein n=1 Tax=Pseudomonas aeruginosa TaxID=287 RepID=UPI001ADCF2BA|nr:hypothetical protein [Pseudomonas aeruginosa]MBO8304751.1 hypothetical protein [Pseudomonas aeruginosa]
METVKVTITAEKPNHTHAGKPVAQGDEIEVSRADAEFLLRRQTDHQDSRRAQGRRETRQVTRNNLIPTEASHGTGNVFLRARRD